MEPADVIRQAIERVVMHLLGPDEKMPGLWWNIQRMRSWRLREQCDDDDEGNSRELAQDLAEKLKKSDVLGEVVDLSRVEVVGPGFINFWLKREWLVGELKQVLEKKGKLRNQRFRKRKTGDCRV